MPSEENLKIDQIVNFLDYIIDSIIMPYLSEEDINTKILIGGDNTNAR